jgi:hypothetical protein
VSLTPAARQQTAQEQRCFRLDLEAGDFAAHKNQQRARIEQRLVFGSAEHEDVLVSAVCDLQKRMLTTLRRTVDPQMGTTRHHK